jgi:hypothetical protein
MNEENLQQVNDIDSQISNLHLELMSLYQQRSAIIEAKNKNQIALNMNNPWDSFGFASSPISWADEQHQRLIDIWSIYGLDLPPIESLRTQLLKAREVIGELVLIHPEFKGNLEVVLVPPTKVLGYPINPQLRSLQVFASREDIMNSTLPLPEASKKWRLLVVYGGPEGIYLDTPKNILKQKKHTIAGHDSRALGLYEYMAFSLQQNEPVDENTWTVLFKNYEKGEQIPIAKFSDGGFVFEFDDVSSIFGDIRFRPAIEVE